MRKLSRNNDDIKEDTLLNKKTIKLYNDKGQMYSYHNVEKYKVAKGDFKDEEYYLFKHKDGKSIMNYNPEDYYELSAHLDISFRYTIFMKSDIDEDRDKDSMILRVSNNYRIKQKSRDFDF